MIDFYFMLYIYRLLCITAQTQIRLLLKQSDQVLPFCHSDNLYYNKCFVNVNILIENRMRKVFKILEHLPQLFKICSHIIIRLQPVPRNQLFLGIIAPLSTIFQSYHNGQAVLKEFTLCIQ